MSKTYEIIIKASELTKKAFENIGRKVDLEWEVNDLQVALSDEYSEIAQVLEKTEGSDSFWHCIYSEHMEHIGNAILVINDLRESGEHAIASSVNGLAYMYETDAIVIASTMATVMSDMIQTL